MEESTAQCEESSSIVAFGQPLFDAVLGSLSLGAGRASSLYRGGGGQWEAGGARVHEVAPLRSPPVRLGNLARSTVSSSAENAEDGETCLSAMENRAVWSRDPHQ